MKRNVAAAIIAAFLPALAYAQATDPIQLANLMNQLNLLQAQIAGQTGQTPQEQNQPTAAERAVCAIVGVRLAQGSRGQAVTTLQELLVAEGFLEASPTGYFGRLTRAA